MAQSQDDGSTGGAMAVDPSEDSLSLMGGEAESIDSSSWSDVITDVEQLSAELANRGPDSSDLKLRYLFQLLTEADCLEWALLVCVVLRDAVLFLRVVNLACLPDAIPEVVLRLKKGVAMFEQWTNTDCPGYRPFLQAVQVYITELEKCVVVTVPTTRQSSLPKFDRLTVITSLEGGTPSNSPTGPTTGGENMTAVRRDSKGDRRGEPELGDETADEVRTEGESRCVVS
jgi:hypothetical protein